ncbi:MAG: DUF2782 domain-containing protein [Burkholderiales bacterium]
MRRVLFPLLLAAMTTAWAQDRPPRLEPLPEAPPPTIRDGADEPRVRIVPPDNDSKVEQVPGGLKVTPPNGPTYYLIELGPNEWVRRDTLDPGVRVPMWTITTFD